MIGLLLIYAQVNKILVPCMLNVFLVKNVKIQKKQYMCHMLHKIKKSLLKYEFFSEIIKGQA